jgi:hypothetical protein
MSDSQEYADVIAMAISLNEDEEAKRYIEILRDYTTTDSMNNPVVMLHLVTVMMTLLSSLLVAASEYMDMDVEDLGNFLLMEKFKRDLWEDNGLA